LTTANLSSTILNIDTNSDIRRIIEALTVLSKGLHRLWGVGALSPSIFSNLQEGWSKGSHAARELATVFSVTSFLVTIVSQLVKTPPSPTEGVSAHH